MTEPEFTFDPMAEQTEQPSLVQRLRASRLRQQAALEAHEWAFGNLGLVLNELGIRPFTTSYFEGVCDDNDARYKLVAAPAIRPSLHNNGVIFMAVNIESGVEFSWSHQRRLALAGYLVHVGQGRIGAVQSYATTTLGDENAVWRPQPGYDLKAFIKEVPDTEEREVKVTHWRGYGECPSIEDRKADLASVQRRTQAAEQLRHTLEMVNPFDRADHVSVQPMSYDL